MRDVDRSVSFYSAVLGSAVQKIALEDGTVFGLLPCSNSEPSGCLVTGPDQVPSHHGAMVYLSVEGRMDDALGAVGKVGGKVLKPKHSIAPHGFRAVIEDSEGNRIALHSQVA